VNLVNERNGWCWHSDVYSNISLNPMKEIWKCLPNENQKCFLNIENEKWNCFPLLITYIF